jgi:hypothetical protein
MPSLRDEPLPSIARLEGGLLGRSDLWSRRPKPAGARDGPAGVKLVSRLEAREAAVDDRF